MADEVKHHPAPTPTPTPAPAPEVKESEFDKEMRLQKEDAEKAVVEEKEAEERMTALPAPFTDVREYWGVGPLAYETRRGFIKVNSGDVICRFEYEDPPESGNVQTEVVILSLVALEALQAANITDPPIGLSARAGRIGAKRRGDDKPKPTQPIAGKPATKPVVGAKPTQLPA